MRNVLKHARPVKGFGPSKPTVSTKLIKRAIKNAFDVSADNRQSFEASIAYSLPDPFPPSLSSYVELMRMMTTIDFSQRAMRKDHRMLNPDLILVPASTELEIEDDGLYGFTATYGFWRFKTERHFAVESMRDGKPQGSTFHPAPDFEFDVFLCQLPVVHPMLVETLGRGLIDERGVTEDAFKGWKRMVMAQRDEAFAKLIGAFQSAYPGIHCWSYTLCKASERLMKTSPGVEVKDGVAFIYSSDVKS